MSVYINNINRKITQIVQYKNAIKEAIKAKGVDVADTDTFARYADKIAAIEQSTGGGSGGGEPSEPSEPSGGYTLEDMIEKKFPSVINYYGSSISAYTFYYAKIVDVNFPNAEIVGSSAFTFCSFLENVSMPKVSEIRTSGFCYCYSLTDVEFPSAASIQSYAFHYCRNLSTITLPVCTTLSYGVFSNCHNLLSVKLGASSVCKITNSSVFTSTPIRGYWNPSYASSIDGQYGSIYVPMSLVDAYKTSTNWTYFSSRIVGY